MSKEQLAAGLQVVAAVGNSIRELGQVPSGTLYASVMAQLSLEQYERILGLLERANLIRRDSSHLLHWTGPKGGAK